MSDGSAYHVKALPTGTVLREWRLDGVLGSGGFGIVYQGTGVYFNEVVAIKEYFPSAISDRRDGLTVAPTDTSSEELYRHGLQKFLEEAKILWNLSRPVRHPNIVCVRNLFEIHGTAYMVMDYEEGVSLSQMLKDGARFDEASLMALIRPVAEGLGRAHSAGVFHRDIKPANILVCEDRRPVLIDFGSARFDAGQVTSTKVTFYTPPYAALEQYVRTFPQGAWTDIYALGVTMYQCITGDKPPEVLERVHGAAETPLAQRSIPGFSQRFLVAVDAAMAIKPEDRPQSVEQWLAMFDGAPIPAVKPLVSMSDEGTRIAVAPPKPPGPRPAPAPTEPMPAPQAEPVVEAEAQPRKKSAAPMIAAAAAVLAIAGAGAAAAVMWPKSPAEAVAPAMPVADAPRPPDLSMGQSFAGLVDAARTAGRPETEISVLAAAAQRVAELNARIDGAFNTGSNDIVARLLAERDEAALAAIRPHMAALATETKITAEKVAGDLRAADAENKAAGIASPDELSEAIVAAAAATQAIEAGAAAALGSDATVAVAAVKAADEGAAKLAGLQPDANIAFLASRRQSFALNSAAAKQAAIEVGKLAGVKKPSVFASREKKDAYKALQDLNAVVQTRVVTLDKASQGLKTAGRTTLAKLAADAATAKTELQAALKTAQANAAKIAD